MKRKTVVIPILGVMVIALGYIWHIRSKNPDAGIEVETVARRDVGSTVSITGTLQPIHYADLSFQTVGKIEAVYVKDGDVVNRGQKIATLDTSVLESQIRDAKVAADIAVATEQLARRTWDDLKPEERTAKKLASEQARQKIQTLHAQLLLSTLTAPMAGTVSMSDMRVGETATIGTRVARISAGEVNDIEAQVPESDVADLRLGMAARVTFDALTRDEVFSATLVDIARAATVAQDVVSYKATFQFDHKDARLREGMTADVDIETHLAKNVLAVPFRAITRENGNSMVEVRREPGVYDRVAIDTGIEGDEGMVEVKSGLHDGDMVVVSRK